MSPLLLAALALITLKAGAEIILLTLARRRALSLRLGPLPAVAEAVFKDRADFDKAMDYSAAKARDGIVGELVGLLIGGALLAGGAAAITTAVGNTALITAIGSDRHLLSALQDALIALSVFAAMSLADLPLDAWSTFGTESRFGFNRVTPALWLVDKLKGALLGLLFGLLLLTPCAWFLLKLPDSWWIWAAAAFLGFQILIAALYPVLLLPLFNKLTPLADESLRTRLLALAARAKFPAAAVLVMDGSKRSARANAFFAGFGKTRRIVFFDTLLARLTPEELEAVLAHEMGHWKRGHIAKTLALVAALALPVFALAGLLAKQPDAARALGFPLEPAVTTVPFGALFPVFVILAGALLYWLSPLLNALSRKHEYEADAYAADLAGGPAPLVSALRKLHAANSGNPLPHPAYALFHHSHPTLPEREAKLRGE